MANTAYIFIDESGDFNFSPVGSKYFTLTSIIATRPFTFVSKLDTLKHDLMDQGHIIEYFHASEGRRHAHQWRPRLPHRL